MCSSPCPDYYSAQLSMGSAAWWRSAMKSKIHFHRRISVLQLCHLLAARHSKICPCTQSDRVEGIYNPLAFFINNHLSFFLLWR